MAQSDSTEKMQIKIKEWMQFLQNYPGWKAWKREHFVHTLYFDDEDLRKDAIVKEFVFSDDVRLCHEVILQYMKLSETATALKECEYYFRRYPFRGMPISHERHITNICEMYFNRFYEFKERLKNYSDALKIASPTCRVDFGALIKSYSKEFDQELRMRNEIHHRDGFEDLSIDRLFLVRVMADDERNHWGQRHLLEYRKLSRIWAQRAKKRGCKLDMFVEIAATIALENCRFEN